MEEEHSAYLRWASSASRGSPAAAPTHALPGQPLQSAGNPRRVIGAKTTAGAEDPEDRAKPREKMPSTVNGARWAPLEGGKTSSSANRRQGILAPTIP